MRAIFPQVHWRYFGSCSDHGGIIMTPTTPLPPSPPSAVCCTTTLLVQQHQHHDFVISSPSSLQIQKLIQIQIHPSHHTPVQCSVLYNSSTNIMPCFPIVSGTHTSSLLHNITKCRSYTNATIYANLCALMLIAVHCSSLKPS